MLNIPFEFDKDKVLDITDLLPTIPIEILEKVTDQNGSVSADEENFLKSVGRAAENANLPVLKGLSAIGVLLANANEEIPLGTFNDVGWLIQSLSEQVLAISHMQGFADLLLDASNKNKISKGNGGLMS
ncbi:MULTISPECIES: hypothetical protein [Acinetobacter]|uniref:Uncharacterized protein n=3 Tax=Acinetobacter baumannii TaxID=470 RepID=D0C5H5_ACIB2|nr:MULTISPECIES: hypothetical protein [Acinetobacter]ALJ99016.1 hypothetical protein [Acinetobacter phage Ab105-3phi]ASK85826.1 hypothetical protein Ab1052phi_78 [Acinetobacter phage Ab105-2phi]QJS52920.1 hypothetical protein phiAb1151011551_00039 [Acinetobacter phage Ab11510-phi]WCF71484.1 antirepressor [Acinetobacter phage Acba_3]WCF71563.1 antirepressor [Acinetobacter phage Acba_1]WCF71706.1 hypothetical protein ACBA11_067 [Acinetobacter phage Acba_11]WCF71780.1 hypothetical protein ACBA1